jgi:hypothetical protein
LPEQVAAPPALTPDGKWLIAAAAGQLVCYQAADGKRAGAIPLPDGWGTPVGTTTLAIHPSGREIAVMLTNREHMLLGIWDLATGQAKDAMVHTSQASQKKMASRLFWAGKRQLLCGDILFDLDLHAALCSSVTVEGITAAPESATPDGRVWSIRTITDSEWARARDKWVPLAGTLPTRMFLTAASVPEAVTTPLEAARQGFLWHPGVSLNVVATESVPAKHRSALEELLAMDLAREGYRIDPNARITVEIDIELGTKTSGVDKQIPEEHLTPAMREEKRRRPMAAWHELTDVYDVTIQGRVLRDDRLALQTRTVMDFVVVKKGAGVDEAWTALTNRGVKKLVFPRLLLRNALHRRLRLPSAITLGVDEVLAADVTPAGAKDEFDLPHDR